MSISDSKPRKSIFVICPIGKDGTSSRINSDKLLKYIIKVVSDELNYSVERADQIAEPGIITNQIVEKIMSCDILIADLSEGNPNVFYELAIRHGLKKPFIHMINKSEKIPFDNAQVRTIQFDLSDLDSVDSAKSELAAQIKSIENGKDLAESPISVAFDLESLRRSDSPDQNILASIFEEISSMRTEIRAVRRQASATRHMSDISSPHDIENLVSMAGDRRLKALFSDARISDLQGSKIGITTSLNQEEDAELEKRMTVFLQAVTSKPWEVTVYPF